MDLLPNKSLTTRRFTHRKLLSEDLKGSEERLLGVMKQPHLFGLKEG